MSNKEIEKFESTENPKTPNPLPRKKQLCKFCREIIHPADKVVFEERSYHRLCLLKLNSDKDNEDDNQSGIKIKINDEDDNQSGVKIRISDEEDNQSSVKIKINDDDQSIDDLSSDKYYEVIDDSLDVKSVTEKSDILDNDLKDELAEDNQNLNADDCQLKSVSSNLSSLNPFDEDEFCEVEPAKSFEIVSSKQETLSTTENEIEKKKAYPKDLNPFGDDDEIEEISKDELPSKNPFGESPTDNAKASLTVYPEELNPFDENDETIEELNENNNSNGKNYLIPKNYSTSSLERYNKSSSSNQFKSFGNLRVNRNSFNQNYDTLSVRSLTPDGKWKSNKSKKAPPPPPSAQLNHQQQNQSVISSSSINASSNVSSNVSLDNNSNVDNKETADDETIFHSSTSLSETENSFASLNESKENVSLSEQQPRRRFKAKKAPPTPSALIRFVGSIEEIENECDQIGDQLLMNQNSIRKIEVSLMDNLKIKHLNRSSIKKSIYDYFNLVQSKCLLAKKQEELMYLKCQNKLEKDQLDTDGCLRRLITKDSKQKTFEDLKEEEDLLEKLVDIIERKNEIEENIMKIDKVDEFNKSVQKIKEYVEAELYDSILKDFRKNHLNESNLKNNQSEFSNDEVKKKNKKAKGFTLKKLTKLKIST